MTISNFFGMKTLKNTILLNANFTLENTAHF